MLHFIKFLARKLLSIGKIRNNFAFLRAFYFCKIKKKIKDFNEVSEYTWKNTLESNKRVVYNKNISLPKKPTNVSILDIGRSLSGGSLNLLFPAIKKKYNKKNKIKAFALTDKVEFERKIRCLCPKGTVNWSRAATIIEDQ